MNSKQRRKEVRALEAKHGKALDLKMATARLMGENHVDVPGFLYRLTPTFIREHRLAVLRTLAHFKAQL